MAMGRSEGGQDDLMATWAGDASLAGTRVLRPAAGAAAGSRFRRVRGAGLQAVLCAEDGRAVAAAGTVFPHAHDRLFRGDRQRARHRMAVRGLVLAARFPAAVEPGQGPRSFVAVAHARAARQRRELSRDADADGERERDRHAQRRGSGALRPQAQGQDAVERGLKSPTDPEAKIARMKDGTTHLAYKPEHAVDLDTGVVVAAPIHAADEGDTTTLSPTLEVAAR